MQIAKFNELEYEVSIFLDNNEESVPSRQYSINPNAIVNLNIEETLADWVTRGTMTIYQSFDNIENKSETAGEVPDNTTYTFKNDGTDILNIKIFPKLDNLNYEVDRKHWELVYKFAIYDVEDIDLPPGAQNAASSATKCKKFYFWDRWYQTMITDVLEYSSATSENNSETAGPGPYTDEQRALPTGIIMKDIIEKAILDNSKFNDLKHDRVAGGSDDDWDEGASKMFFTAPAFATAYDCLMYVYSRHVSTTKQSTTGAGGPRGSNRITGSLNDFCILTKERGPEEGDEGYLSLRPMSEYFEKAGKSSPGEFQIERFLVQGYAPDEQKPKVKRSPTLDEQNMQIDTKLGQYSLISSYRFVDIAPVTDATYFRTTPVHSFDFSKRLYNIEFKNNSAETARDFMVKQYVSKVLTDKSSSKEGNFLLTLNENKENNRNVVPVFSLFGSEFELQNRQADGLQKILKTGVFQNSCINFRTLGSTNREAGRFIAIDRDDEIDDNDFNNKFFGQWFIINVSHIFEGGIYYNDITAVKLHRFKPASS